MAAVRIQPTLSKSGIAGFAFSYRAGDVKVVSANQAVRTHKQISNINGEALRQLAINFKTGLLSVRQFAVVAIHATGTYSAGRRAGTADEFGGILAGQEYAL